MGEYFEKMFFWEEFLCFYSKDRINFIGNSSSEKRSDNTGKIDMLNKKCQCVYFFLDYDYEEDSFICNNEKYDLTPFTGFLTVTLHVSFFFPYLAVMTAVPFFLAFTTPVLETVATLFLLLVQVIFLLIPFAFNL